MKTFSFIGFSESLFNASANKLFNCNKVPALGSSKRKRSTQ